jgi:hypothetical protein
MPTTQHSCPISVETNTARTQLTNAPWMPCPQTRTANKDRKELTARAPKTIRKPTARSGQQQPHCKWFLWCCMRAVPVRGGSSLARTQGPRRPGSSRPQPTAGRWHIQGQTAQRHGEQERRPRKQGQLPHTLPRPPRRRHTTVGPNTLRYVVSPHQCNHAPALTTTFTSNSGLETPTESARHA